MMMIMDFKKIAPSNKINALTSLIIIIHYCPYILSNIAKVFILFWLTSIVTLQSIEIKCNEKG
ncbi:hypothetical protein BLOT_001113 [Blomia tropicalis]|nr:hypothetical protein BLOT_001113 [Blomia tropicalis]